jgi:formate-dependent nitrite reductase membrane component NrfD
MINNFTVELRGQQEWAWLVAIDLFFGGVGGGLFLLFHNFNLSPAVGLLSLGLVAVGGLVLMAELGHPMRAWRAMAKPRTSWISRGMISVFLFILLGFLYIASSLPAFSWLPWSPGSPAGRVMGTMAGICALLVTLYPGFVLSASPSIPFWNSPLMPILFFAQSLLGASAIVILFSGLGLSDLAGPGLFSLAAVLIITNLALIAIHLWTLGHSGLAAKEAVGLLQRGSLGWIFNVGVVLVGMVFPLVVMVWVPSAMIFAGVFILIGGLLFRYCVLKAGVYVSFALV